MSRKRRTPADEPFQLMRSSAGDLPAAMRIGGHRHDWHQLIYVTTGLIVVETERGSWLAPPRWAVWVPAFAEHAIRFVGESTLRTVYIRPDRRFAVPAGCCSLAVSALLRELVLRTIEHGMLDARDAIEAAIASLLIAELGREGPPPFTLPQPTSKAMVQAANLLSAGGQTSLAAVAKATGVGTRTLERRFRAETGLTPGRWQQQRKLLIGLELIASGKMVKTASAEAGFASPSAYVAAFRTMFGTTPARYFTPS